MGEGAVGEGDRVKETVGYLGKAIGLEPTSFPQYPGLMFSDLCVSSGESVVCCCPERKRRKRVWCVCMSSRGRKPVVCVCAREGETAVCVCYGKGSIG